MLLNMKSGLLILTICLSGLPMPSCHNNKLVFTKKIDTVVMASYGGFHHEGEVSFFNSSGVPFNVRDFIDDYIAVGDTFTIKYSGSWMTAEINPPIVTPKNLVFYDATIKHTPIFELEVVENKNGNFLQSLNPEIEINSYKLGSDYDDMLCINLDYSFQKISTYPVGTKIWGAKYPWSDENDVYALYSFDIRTQKDFVLSCGV